MKNLINSFNPILLFLTLGLLGGISLVYISGMEQSGSTVIPIFAVILFVSVVLAKLKSGKQTFSELFLSSFIPFSIMVVIDFAFLVWVVNPALQDDAIFNNVLRLAAMFGICAFFSFVAAILFKSRS